LVVLKASVRLFLVCSQLQRRQQLFLSRRLIEKKLGSKQRCYYLDKVTEDVHGGAYLFIVFKLVKNVGDVFLRHSVLSPDRGLH